MAKEQKPFMVRINKEIKEEVNKKRKSSGQTWSFIVTEMFKKYLGKK